MKRLFGIVVAAMLASSVFAGPFSSLTKSLNSLDMSQSEEISGKLAEGRDLLPIVWKYAKADDELTNGVVDFFVTIKNINLVEKRCDFEQTVVFKFGGGLQKQESEVTVKQTENGFVALTTGMRTGNVDKNGNAKGKPIDNPTSSWNKNSKNIASEFEKISKTITEEEYNDCFNGVVASPFALDSVADKSALAFKKYVADNEIIGRKTSMTIIVTKVDEAPKQVEGFSYFVQGVALSGYKKDKGLNRIMPAYTTVYFYTNSEDVVSLTPVDIKEIVMSSGKAGSRYDVRGTIFDISRFEGSGVVSVSIKVKQ